MRRPPGPPPVSVPTGSGQFTPAVETLEELDSTPGEWENPSEPEWPPFNPQDDAGVDAAHSPLQGGVTPVTRLPTGHTAGNAPGSSLPDSQAEGNGVTGVMAPSKDGVLSGLVSGSWLESQTFPEVEYAVPRLVPEGFTLLVGAPKAGKSWLALLTALGVAGLGTVLGLAVQQRPVLYLALEDSHRRLRWRCKHLYPDAGIPAGMHIMTAIPPGFTAPACIEAWMDTLPRNGLPPLVIVDTLGKVRPGKRPGEGVYEYDYRIGGRMKQLADNWPGSALVAVHHDRKAGAADFVDDVSGSNGLAGAADSILVVRRDRNSPDGVLLITGRDVTEGAYAAQFHDGHWSLTGGGFDQASATYTRTAAVVGRGDTAHQIVRWLTSNQPAGPTRIAEAVGLEVPTVKMSLQRMVQAGQLDRAGGRYFLPDYHPGNQSEDPTGGPDAAKD